MPIEISSPRRFGKVTLQREWMARRGTLPVEAPPPECLTCRKPMLCAAHILEGAFWEPVYVRSCACGVEKARQQGFTGQRWLREAFIGEANPWWGWKRVEDR